MPSNTVYPLSAIRALALHAQGLARPLVAGGKPIRDEVYAAIEQIGGVQIDTLQMVSRSQYLTLESPWKLRHQRPGHAPFRCR